MHPADVTHLFKNSAYRPLQREAWEHAMTEAGRRPGMELGKGPFTVCAVRLEGLGGVLSHPTQPDYIFAHEVAGRIRVIAGLDQQPNMIHDERWPDGGALAELRRLRARLGCSEQDALVVVWGPADDTVTAAEEIHKRFADALDGVPNETRQPFPDGHTDFERILPGPDRMYPDTDSPPSRITPERVAKLRAPLPPPPWEREARYGTAGVPIPTIHYLIRRGGADLVDRVVAATGDEPAGLRRACFFFGERLKGWRRAGVPVDAIPPERWLELFVQLAARPLLWDVVAEIVRRLAADPGQPVAAAVGVLELDGPPAGWRERVVEAVRQREGERPALGADARRRWHLGQALRGLRGRAAVAEVAAAVEKGLGT
ncbi:MAG: hypothetical protein JXQ29_03420, partial [Planctomycetes bacterium]|nr:hypothetical protein [Planctomycetota bacterium]